MTRALRRAWRTLTDPPASSAAASLRTFIPIGAVCWAATLILQPRIPLTTLADLLWASALLHVVRQRDHARTQLATARKETTTR